MGWQVVARQDAALTVGERSVKFLLGIVGLAILAAAYVYPLFDDPATTARFTGYVAGWLATLIPLVGILLGYNAVASERQSGALLLSLSLPHSRRDVVLGKFLGRTGAFAAAIVASMIAAGFLVVYPFGDLEVPRSLAFVGLTVAFAAIWTGLGTAVSLAVATKRRALVLGLVLLFVFVFVWDAAATALEFGLNRAGIIDGSLPAPARFVFGLEPGNAYERVTDGFLDPSASVEGPWYLGEWVGLVVLGGWIVVPLWLAFRRFERRDLA